MKSISIVTTVGTSLITNFLENPNKAVSSAKKHLESKSYYDFDKQRTQDDNVEISNSKQIIENNLKTYSNCAEISSLDAIRQELQKEDANIQIKVYLICTDTVLSPLCAGIIETYLKKDNKFSVEFGNKEEYIIKDLRVDDKDLFENSGFEGLMACIDKIATNPKNCILNISGGYKALIPPLTLYGQLKNIPLNYKYEDSPHIIEIGNLPIGIDWSFVEALKPFLNLEFHPLWLNGGKDLANLLINRDIYFDKTNKVFKTNKDDLKNIIRQKDKEQELFIIKHLLDNKLLSKRLTLTVLGKILQKVDTLEGYKGYEMEYILYHYFAHCDSEKDANVKQYQSSIPLKLSGSFKFENGKLIIVDKEDKIKEPYRAFGDIDLSLNRGNIIVLGECKAFSTFLGYADEKSGKKYYEQLSARLQRFTEQHLDKITIAKSEVELEMLMIVFQFQFEGFETSILENETVKTIYKKFKEIERFDIKVDKQENLTIKPIFNILGVKCLIEFNNTKSTANYTQFYHKPKLVWEVLG